MIFLFFFWVGTSIYSRSFFIKIFNNLPKQNFWSRHCALSMGLATDLIK